jgi:hypothetical protein
MIGEPSPMTMPPNRLPDPVLDADLLPARAIARTADFQNPVATSHLLSIE